MTSRERILTALDHREPDRVPIDLGAHRSSGISAIAYAKLKKALGIDSGDIYVYDTIQQLAIVEDEVLDYRHNALPRILAEEFDLIINPDADKLSSSLAPLPRGKRSWGLGWIREGWYLVLTGKLNCSWRWEPLIISRRPINQRIKK